MDTTIKCSSYANSQFYQTFRILATSQIAATWFLGRGEDSVVEQENPAGKDRGGQIIFPEIEKNVSEKWKHFV